MNTDLATILVVSVVATLNPTLVAAMLVMVLLPNPKRLMLGYLAGAYTTSIAAGVAIAFPLRGSGLAGTSKHILGPAGDIAAGAIVLAVAFMLATGHDGPLLRWRSRRKAAKASKPTKQPWQQRMLGKGSAAVAFVVGAGMSFPGLAYLSALHHIVMLKLSILPVLLLIIFFCLMQQILLELTLLAFVVAPGRTQAVVVGFRTWLTRHVRQIAVTGVAGMGTLLVVLGLTTIN
jgi:hypothetical protein